MENNNPNIIVLGATGMLGHIIFTELIKNNSNVFGTVKALDNKTELFNRVQRQNLIPGINIDDFASVSNILTQRKPAVIINCIGLIKQLPQSNDLMRSIQLNSLLPHRLARLAQSLSARVIHFSTDCVFTGKKGNYTETDIPDAEDAYGISKLLGELHYTNTFTFRTSIIGHELITRNGLVEWFLSQKQFVNGYAQVVYSGFPTVEIARIVQNHILSNQNLHGLYQISSEPITKYDLLKKIASIYHFDITIHSDTDHVSNMSLNSNRFRKETGYIPPSWDALLSQMHKQYEQSHLYNHSS